MKYLVFDTETTGLRTKDEVIQFSGLLLDDKCKLLRLFSFYCDTLVDIHPEAERTHGLSKTRVHELSKGRFFEEQFYAIPHLQECTKMKDITWVGYNVPFDIRLINQTLMNNGYSAVDFGRKVNTLSNTGVCNFDVHQAVRAYYNRGIAISLSNAVEKYCDTPMSTIVAQYKKLLRYTGFEGNANLHDSLFDTFLTYKLLEQIWGVFQ